MKKIPILTVILWISMILGYKFYPGVFHKDLFQYPLIILLSILLPTSFWIKVNEKKRLFSLIYILIFILNVVVLIFVTERNFSAQGNKTSLGIIPEVVEMLSNKKDFDRSFLAAQYIFHHHAVPVAYRNMEDNFVLFVPSEADKIKYQEIAAKMSHLEVAQMDAKVQMLSACFLLMLHVSIFLFLLVFLVIYDRKPNLRMSY